MNMKTCKKKTNNFLSLWRHQSFFTPVTVIELDALSKRQKCIYITYVSVVAEIVFVDVNNAYYLKVSVFVLELCRIHETVVNELISSFTN